MVLCPSCKSDNAAETRFCTRCGVDLQTDLGKFLTRCSLSDISSALHKNDISTVEQLLSLTDGDLGEIGMPVGDQLRLRKAVRELQEEPSGRLNTQEVVQSVLARTALEQLSEPNASFYRHRKTLSAAFLWALFLGPVGIFYYSWRRGVVTLLVVTIAWLLLAPFLPDSLWSWLAVWSGIPCAVVVFFGLGARHCA